MQISKRVVIQTPTASAARVSAVRASAIKASAVRVSADTASADTATAPYVPAHEGRRAEGVADVCVCVCVSGHEQEGE